MKGLIELRQRGAILFISSLHDTLVARRPHYSASKWREPLDPAVDADMVDLDAPLGEELFDVAVGQSEA